MSDLFTIGELASAFALSPRAIRFYEDQGLLAPERAGTQRIYTKRDRARLQLILRGKRLGLSLLEIRSLLDMYETPADTVPQLTRFLEVLDARRDSLQHQLADLTQLLADIDRQRTDAESMLQALQAGRQPRRQATAQTAALQNAGS